MLAQRLLWVLETHIVIKMGAYHRAPGGGCHIQNSNTKRLTELEPSLREGRAARAELNRQPSAADGTILPSGYGPRASVPTLPTTQRAEFQSWRDFLAAAAVIRPMLAISPSAREEVNRDGRSRGCRCRRPVSSASNRDQVRSAATFASHPQGNASLAWKADVDGADRPPKLRAETCLKAGVVIFALSKSWLSRLVLLSRREWSARTTGLTMRASPCFVRPHGFPCPYS